MRYAADVELLEGRYSRSYLSKAETAAHILTKRPELATRRELSRLSAALGTQSVNVFDATDTMTATSSGYSSFALSDDPADPSYAFRQLLRGVDSYVQEAQPDEISKRYLQYTVRLLQQHLDAEARIVCAELDEAARLPDDILHGGGAHAGAVVLAGHVDAVALVDFPRIGV